MDLVGLSILMRMQPNTTRGEFKTAYDMVDSLATGRCNKCWQGIAYAPIVPHAQRAVYEANAQSDLNNTRLRFFNYDYSVPAPNSSAAESFRSSMVARAYVTPTAAEYVPAYYGEPMASNWAGTHMFFPDLILLHSPHRLKIVLVVLLAVHGGQRETRQRV
jgi:hypothetical protein